MTSILQRWIEHSGHLGFAGYVFLALVFLVGALVPIPRTPVCIASGLVFGLQAIPDIALSSALGGMIAFVIARHGLQTRVRRWLAHSPRSLATLRAVDVEGWRIIALMRFYGPVPSTVQNYGFGLTTVGFWTYSIVTFFFSIPQIAFYVYLGRLGKQAVKGESDAGPYANLLPFVALTCFALAFGLVYRRVQIIMSQAESNGNDADAALRVGHGREASH